MMDDEVLVESSWSFDAKCMQSCLKVVCKEGNKLEFSPEEVSLESCVQFNKVKENPCSITLNSKHASKRISNILLISECRRIEVYERKDGEYLGTFQGTLMEEASDEEMIIFSISIDLSEKSVSSCYLKVIGLGAASSFWTLSFQVKMSPDPMEPLPSKRFDMDAVQALLGNTELSEKAKDFQKLFENFQTTAPTPLLPAMPLPVSVPNSSSMTSNDTTPIMMVIDRRIQEVETRLHNKISEIEQRQNEKLDKIIQLLEKK